MRKYRVEVANWITKQEFWAWREVTVEEPDHTDSGEPTTWNFTRKYETHAEAWVIRECQGTMEQLAEKYYDGNMFFRDREGHPYLVWHNFFRTNQAADDNLEDVADREGKVNLWKVNL